MNIVPQWDKEDKLLYGFPFKIYSRLKIRRALLQGESEKIDDRERFRRNIRKRGQKMRVRVKLLSFAILEALTMGFSAKKSREKRFSSLILRAIKTIKPIHIGHIRNFYAFLLCVYLCALRV